MNQQNIAIKFYFYGESGEWDVRSVFSILKGSAKFEEQDKSGMNLCNMCAGMVEEMGKEGRERVEEKRRGEKR